MNTTSGRRAPRRAQSERRSADPKELCGDGLLRPFPDAAEFLAIGRSAIFQLLKTGEIPYVRVATERRIPRAALVAYAAGRLVQADGK